MADAPSPKATPKRKRAEQQPVPTTPIKFSFSPANADSPTDGNHSPRTSVALRFRGLALGGGADAAAEPGETADLFVRKRVKSDLAAAAADLGAAAPDPQPDAARPEPDGLSAARALPWPQPDVTLASGPSSSAALPVVDRPPEPRSPGRRRAGTPPLRLKQSPAGHDDAEVSVADPVRAALTWHDDEITVYDADDADDDGTGINGIGFKPTPALAHARAMRRRQQMADYRRREESEARAKRSQRRRGDVPSGRVKKKSPSRRVRFVDAESQKIAVETA